jgi:hypothetical protein
MWLFLIDIIPPMSVPWDDPGVIFSVQAVVKCPHFAFTASWASQMCRKTSCDKTSTFCLTAGRTSQMCLKIMWQIVHILLQDNVDIIPQSIMKRVDVMSHVTNCPPQSRGGWKYLDRSSSQGQVVTTDGLLGWRIVWVELWRSRFVGEWIVKAPPPLQ